MKRRILISWLLCLLPLCCIQAQESHWQCDIRSFQYDMTMYVALSLDGTPIVQDGYEVAAFCGDECRGVATLETIAGTDKAYYYLRVRSNVTEGETITFKYYHTGTRQEVALDGTVDFVSQAVIGYPSAPFVLTGVNTLLPGDVNGDTKITAVDMMMLINKVLGKQVSSSFIEAGADTNADGKVTAVDLMKIINIILGK